MDGTRTRIPTLTLPVGAVDAERVPLFRVACEWPCDRVSLYLMNAGTGPGIGKANPPPFLIEVWLGVECAEEPIVSAVVSPPTYTDAGHILTFATSQLFESIVITGTTITDVTPPPAVPVNLRLFADKAGICCAENPIYGAMAEAPP